jgi:hypothetical protein
LIFRHYWFIGLSLLLVLVASLAAGIGSAAAQEDGQVQELTGIVDPGEIVIYQIPDLKKGQVLYIYATATSGNLDPLVMVTDSDFHPEVLETDFESALDQALDESLDPFEAIEAFRDQHALAWDDDSGGGLSAALTFEVPEDDDYMLVFGGALSIAGGYTFGNYRMLVGLDEPQVLEGDTEITGEIIAIRDVNATPPGIGVQEINGSLSPEKTSTFVELYDFKEDDTLSVYLESTSGDLTPTLVLANFASKPIRSSNLDGKNTQASLQYTFPTDSRNYRLEIASCCEGDDLTYGDYRLLIGVNAPEVLSGDAEAEGRVVAREPIEVGVGFVLEQITDVDLQSEFFTAVSSLQLKWTDPTLAFNPESCQCDFKTYSEINFEHFLEDSHGRWPDFTFQNQQGNRWTQNRNVVVFHDGRVIYSERFTTDFQVDFDFRQFPFSTQQFVVRIDAISPEEFYTYKDLEDISVISSEYGEDEFILQDLTVDVSRRLTNSGFIASRYTFSFEATQHLSYYIFRIFVPILLIILVSWVTFFLKNYTHRIEVASANLLLFIAFSFSLADNYPRLGYMTFLDAVMAIMFIINALVIVYNVWLRRLEVNGKIEMVERIDNVLDWVYPLIYVTLFVGLVVWFF